MVSMEVDIRPDEVLCPFREIHTIYYLKTPSSHIIQDVPLITSGGHPNNKYNQPPPMALKFARELIYRSCHGKCQLQTNSSGHSSSSSTYYRCNDKSSSSSHCRPLPSPPFTFSMQRGDPVHAMQCTTQWRASMHPQEEPSIASSIKTAPHLSILHHYHIPSKESFVTIPRKMF